MKKISIDSLRKINLDHLIFLAFAGPEALDGYIHIRNIAKEKAKKIILTKKPIK
jgi:hypothetical protein